MAKGKKGTSRGNGGSGKGGGFDASVQKLVAGVQTAATAFTALGLPGLTAEQRQASLGKLRVGEADAMETILDAMDAFPDIFSALAAKDGGVDPATVETGPARGWLAESQALAPLSGVLHTLSQAVSDAILALAGETKELTVAAYQIGRASAASDPRIAKAMATALDFYGHSARKKQRAKKVAATRAKRAGKATAAAAANSPAR